MEKFNIGESRKTKNMNEDKKKLLQLIATGEQCNIDLGVYQWLAQGFDKTELVNEYIAKQEFNKADIGESFRVCIGNFRYYCTLSDYTNFEAYRVFNDIVLMSGRKVIHEETIQDAKQDEYAKYYLRKMLDLLEQQVIKREKELSKQVA